MSFGRYTRFPGARPSEARGALPPRSAAPRIVFAGGWTAGHVVPAIAIAEAFEKLCGGVDAVLMASSPGRAARLFERAGYRLRCVEGGPFYGVGSIGRARSLAAQWRGWRQARRMLREDPPDLVIGLGGFGAVPAVLAARSLGIPTAIHEANALPGLANRILAPWVERIYLGLPSAAFGSAEERTLLTGNPVREAIAEIARAARPARPDGGPIRVLVSGGSQGSRFLDERVPALIATLAGSGAAVEVLHQTGHGDVASVLAAYAGAVACSVVPFVDDMAVAYRSADVAITRAGAGTLAELDACALPALVVPIAGAPHDHQRRNAAVFAANGRARLLEERDWRPGVALRLVHDLLASPAPPKSGIHGRAAARIAEDCIARLSSRRFVPPVTPSSVAAG